MQLLAQLFQGLHPHERRAMHLALFKIYDAMGDAVLFTVAFVEIDGHFGGDL